MPSATRWGSSPASPASAIAHRALATLNSPVSGTRAGMRSPPGVTTVNEEPSGSSTTSSARQSAGAPEGENVTIGTPASSTSRRPNGSSTLVRPRLARSGVNSDALAAK